MCVPRLSRMAGAPTSRCGETLGQGCAKPQAHQSVRRTSCPCYTAPYLKCLVFNKKL